MKNVIGNLFFITIYILTYWLFYLQYIFYSDIISFEFSLGHCGWRHVIQYRYFHRHGDEYISITVKEEPLDDYPESIRPFITSPPFPASTSGIKTEVLTNDETNVGTRHSPAIGVEKEGFVESGTQGVVCNTCGAYFPNLNDFRDHKTTSCVPTEPSKPINSKQCSLCEKCYPNSTLLLRHLRITHYKVRYQCTFNCGKTFTRKYAVKRHLREVHGKY